MLPRLRSIICAASLQAHMSMCACTCLCPHYGWTLARKSTGMLMHLPPLVVLEQAVTNLGRYTYLSLLLKTHTLWYFCTVCCRSSDPVDKSLSAFSWWFSIANCQPNCQRIKQHVFYIPIVVEAPISQLPGAIIPWL